MKLQNEEDIDPELLGKMGHISRERNLSLATVKNMVLRVGLTQMGESTEYDKTILDFRLLNQRLDILLDSIYDLRAYKLGDKFSVGFISVTLLMKADCNPDVFYKWEEEMIRLLVDIECLDKGIFTKIKKQLKNLKRLWRLYPKYKENYLETRGFAPIVYSSPTFRSVLNPVKL